MYYEKSQEIPLNWPVTDYTVGARRTSGGGTGTALNIPVLDTNILVTGVSGYGKTVFTKAYVKQLFNIDENKYTVFFQIKQDDFTKEFLRPQDKVISYSDNICPKQNLFQWNLVKEIRLCPKSEWDSVLEEIASILFSDLLLDSRNRIWVDAAKATFKAFIKVILYQYRNNPSNYQVINAMQTMNRTAMLNFLREYKKNLSMLSDNFEFTSNTNTDTYIMPKRGRDILFFLQNILDRFNGTFLSESGQDTIYEYLHGMYGERLFMLHDYAERHSVAVFERYFLKYICDKIMSLNSSFNKQMVLILDEIDKIEGDFGLTQAATLGRQFGLQCILSTQSLESLYAIAPELCGEHLVNASLAGFGMTVTFHPGDPHTIETLQALYGKHVKQTITLPFTRYDKITTVTEMRPIVDEHEFATLDIGECYVKIRASDPQRVKIILEASC